jgi:polyhydroxyalkanoate synthesis regulator phasin
MDANAKRKLVVGVAAGLLLLGAGGAFAAGRLTSPRDESQAAIDDAAKRLGVEPDKLSDALKAALEDRVDAAVADGRLTKAEGDALKARIESGDIPLLFGGPHVGPRLGFGFGHVGGFGLDAAANYLGVTTAQLRSELESGKTLADVARAHDETVAGLVDALTADAKAKLDAAVKAGRLTQSQADDMLAELKSHVTDFVNGRPPAGRPFRHDPFGERLDAAATYLGITEEQLQTELRNGKSLADVAKAHGKTAAGLVAALVADAKTKLDAAVEAGKLTRADANDLLSGLKDRITSLVNGRFPVPPAGPEGFGFRFHGGPGFRGFHGGNGAFLGPPPVARTA